MSNMSKSNNGKSNNRKSNNGKSNNGKSNSGSKGKTFSSILGLNNLKNSAKKFGSNIESGIKGAQNKVSSSFKGATNAVSSSIQGATNTIMPKTVTGSPNGNNNGKSNGKNNSVSLGDLLIGENENNGNSGASMSSLTNSLAPKKSSPESETVSSNIEKLGDDLKNTVKNTSALVVGMGWFKYVLLFVILLFLGINIFSYLAKTSTYFANLTEAIFGPIANLFGFSLVKTVEKVVDTSAEGAKFGIDLTKDAIDDVLTLGQGESGSNSKSFIGELESGMTPENENNEPEPTDSSSTMASNTNSKGGYCYAGVDRGYRSCVKISDGEQCISGKIFPTKELCVNPSIRT